MTRTLDARGPGRAIALLVLTGLLAGACASARGLAPQGSSPSATREEHSLAAAAAPAASAWAPPGTPSPEPEPLTCEERVREERKTEVIRAGVNTGLLTGAWMAIQGGAQGAFWGLVAGTRDGAWIGAAVGAGVGLVLGVVNGIEAARQVKGQLAYAPAPCPAEAIVPVAAVGEADAPTP